MLLVPDAHLSHRETDRLRLFEVVSLEDAREHRRWHGLSGPEFRAQQLEDEVLARIPVVVLSALEEARQQEGLRGARAYLKKPIEAEMLLDTLRRLC